MNGREQELKIKHSPVVGWDFSGEEERSNYNDDPFTGYATFCEDDPTVARNVTDFEGSSGGFANGCLFTGGAAGTGAGQDFNETWPIEDIDDIPQPPKPPGPVDPCFNDPESTLPECACYGEKASLPECQFCYLNPDSPECDPCVIAPELPECQPCAIDPDLPECNPSIECYIDPTQPECDG